MNYSSLLNPVARLAKLIKNCQTWAEVEQAFRLFPQYKDEAWQILTEIEKAQIQELKHPLLKPLTSIQVGDRVFVIADIYRTESIGVVECVRGFGTLQMLEVRMPDKKIQVVSPANVRRQA